MILSSQTLTAFLAAHQPVVVAELTAVRGSSPREAGAFMLIAAEALLGTIGGGALEYMVIDRARQALRAGLGENSMDIPLGPEIGQCCGGRVTVSLRPVTAALGAGLERRLARAAARHPAVFVFGSGHVGRALAGALAPLPLRVTVVDTRPDELAGLPAGVTAQATALPEAVVRNAPVGSSYVILTHDHALDFLIAAEALARPDAPYVGMVGSRSKRGRFASWYRSEGGRRAALERLVLPIGGRAFPDGLGDKRPEVIAALAAAEILVQIGSGGAATVEQRQGTEGLGTVDGR